MIYVRGSAPHPQRGIEPHNLVGGAAAGSRQVLAPGDNALVGLPRPEPVTIGLTLSRLLRSKESLAAKMRQLGKFQLGSFLSRSGYQAPLPV